MYSHTPLHIIIGKLKELAEDTRGISAIVLTLLAIPIFGAIDFDVGHNRGLYWSWIGFRCDGDVLGGDYRVSVAPFRIFYPCDCVGLDPWQNWRTKFRPRNADGAL